MMHAFNLNTWKAEAGQSLLFQGQLGLYNEFQNSQSKQQDSMEGRAEEVNYNPTPKENSVVFGK